MARVVRPVAILALMLITLVSLAPSGRANPGPHVAVPQSPLSAGQSVYITYGTNPGEDGTALVCIGKTDTTCLSGQIWDSGWITITGGLAYDVTAPSLSTPGTYYAGVDFCQNSPGPCSNMQYMHQAFHVVGSTTTTMPPSTLGTDWAVLSVSLSPPNPSVGDPVTFSMAVTALTSQAPFPQTFAAVCQIDGGSCGGWSLSYPGPVGTPMTVTTQTPWIATAGTHTLTWGVATIPVGQDPDKSNNAMSKSFTVPSQPPTSSTAVTTTTAASTITSGPPSVTISTRTVTQPPPSVTPPPSGTDYTPIAIAIVAAAAIMALALMRKRGPPATSAQPSPAPSSSQPPSGFCSNCGAQLLPQASFCKKCGRSLASQN